jgi:hypothetical protein
MIAPPSAVTVSGPSRLRSVFIGGDLSTFSATDPEGTDSSIQKFTAASQVLVKSLGVIWCTIRFADSIEVVKPPAQAAAA